MYFGVIRYIPPNKGQVAAQPFLVDAQMERLLNQGPVGYMALFEAKGLFIVIAEPVYKIKVLCIE